MGNYMFREGEGRQTMSFFSYNFLSCFAVIILYLRL